MPKQNKPREEPTLRIDDLENEAGRASKKWPSEDDFQDDIEEIEQDEPIAGILDHPSYIDLTKKLTAAEDAINDYRNQELQRKADVENMRRRAEGDVANAHKYALAKFTNDLLPVLDSLERALASDVSDNVYAQKIHEGIELTMSLFLNTLTKYGVKQIDPLNEMFNPELHQAIATQPNKAAPNTVLEVLQKGYLLNDRLVRPALVVVSASN